MGFFSKLFGGGQDASEPKPGPELEPPSYSTEPGSLADNLTKFDPVVRRAYALFEKANLKEDQGFEDLPLDAKRALVRVELEALVVIMPFVTEHVGDKPEDTPIHDVLVGVDKSIIHPLIDGLLDNEALHGATRTVATISLLGDPQNMTIGHLSKLAKVNVGGKTFLRAYGGARSLTAIKKYA